MVIEYARNVVGLEGASSSEFEPDSKYPVIATMEEQLDIVDGKGDLGGTMRLGLYEAKLDEGSVVAETYGATTVSERHRHRYEVNNKYRDQIAAKGLSSPERRPTASWSSSWNFPATSTRTTWPRRRTPSSARGPPARTRCSRA